jgi:hypothetical protein
VQVNLELNSGSRWTRASLDELLDASWIDSDIKDDPRHTRERLEELEEKLFRGQFATRIRSRREPGDSSLRRAGFPFPDDAGRRPVPRCEQIA